MSSVNASSRIILLTCCRYKCVDVTEEGKKFLTILASSTATSVTEHACALKNRYEITLESSELLCMNNCMSLVLNKHYWFSTVVFCIIVMSTHPYYIEKIMITKFIKKQSWKKIARNRWRLPSLILQKLSLYIEVLNYFE